MKKNNYSKYVPVNMCKIDLHQLYLAGGLASAKKESLKIKSETDNKFEKCYTDCVFSWDAYFDQFGHATIRDHFNTLYTQHFSKFGKNYMVFVRRCKHGDILKDSISDDVFEVLNLCGATKVTLNDINRKMREAEEKSGKPVIAISCGRDLTGVTETWCHGVIMMGTIHSPENYIQYGLRGKNTYDGRQYACTIFDMNTYSFLECDAFKGLIRTKSKYRDGDIKSVAKSYLDAFEIFDLNGGDILIPDNNFIDKFIESMYVSIDGSHVCFEAIFEKEDIENELKLMNLTGTCGEVLKQIITDKQCGTAKAINTVMTVTEVKEKTEADKKELNVDKLWNEFKQAVNIIPSLMIYHDIKTVDSLLNKIDIANQWFVVGCGFDLNNLVLLKTALDQKDKNIFKNFCVALEQNINKKLS